MICGMPIDFAVVGGNSATKTQANAHETRRGTHMAFAFDRRFLAAAGAVLLALAAPGPAVAQTATNLRFSAVFSEQDIRAEMMKRFAEDIKGQGFTLQPYYGGTLFKQGTELVAMQRGNLEMGNIAPQDISNQIPAWSIVTSAYLFRDADHLKRCLRAMSASNSRRWPRTNWASTSSARPISAPAMWA